MRHISSVILVVLLISIALPTSSFGHKDGEPYEIKLCILKDEAIPIIHKHIDSMTKIAEEGGMGPYTPEDKERIKRELTELHLKDLSKHYRLIENTADCPKGMSLYHPPK